MAVAVQSLKVAELILDSELQSRTSLNPETVSEYAEWFGRVDSDNEVTGFPPIEVFEVDGRNYVTDGFHRVEGAKLAKVPTISAKVYPGATREEALIGAAGANGVHGLKRTPDDKRRSVSMVLQTSDGSSWSDGEIARWCSVSPPFVGKVRAELRPPTQNVLSCTHRKGRDGKFRDVSNIGKKTAPKPTAEQPDYRTTEAKPPRAEPIVEQPKQAGQSKVNGVLQDDPPEVAKQRAEGKIRPGVVPEIETSDEPTTVEDVAADRDERKGKTDEDLSDDDWLATLPLHSKLSGVPLKTFEEDALAYRELEKSRASFANHVARIVNKCRRKGPFIWALRNFLKIDHPRRWVRCSDPKDGGCAGVGHVPLVGDCLKCRGKGYRVNNG